MQRSTTLRILIPLLIVCLLLTACGPANNRVTNNQTPNSNQDICPYSLSSTPHCLTPHALRVAYGIEPLTQKGFTGKGQTIIDITSFDSPTLQQDMQIFDQTFNLPPVDLQVISPLNTPEVDPEQSKDQWAQVTIQGVQMIHAMAPEAKIVILESHVGETQGTFGLPEFRALLQYASDHHLGNIVTMRWHASEATLQDAQGQQEMQKWNDLLEQGAMQDHFTYFTTSGFSGATSETEDDRHLVNAPTICFPSDLPWVTSVGGTSLLLSSSGSRSSETAWKSSGGGFSHFYQTPSYQQLLPAGVQKQFNNQRGIPDVAVNEDIKTGPALYINGDWKIASSNSGTSIWAGISGYC